MKERICKLCGQKFIPRSPRQLYCKTESTKQCPVCGDTYTVLCGLDQPITCSKSECKKRAGYLGSTSAERTCKICGSIFKPTSSTQQYCNKPITRKCAVCGNDFTIQCTAEQYKQSTCSAECANKLASTSRQQTYMQQTRVCELCGEEFHPRSNTQKVCEQQHHATCKVCGKTFPLTYKSNIGQTDLRQTCSKECFRQLYRDSNPFDAPEAREKYKQTMLKKYGVEHPMQSAELKERMFASYKDRTGYDHPAHNPDTLKGKKLNISSLEKKVATVLDNHNIKYETQKLVSKENIHHKFDFYLPHYRMYVDVDGAYYHGYLDDSNGEQVSEDRDDSRLVLIDKDEIFIVLPEIGLNNHIDKLIEQLNLIDSNTFDYATYMFNWCRSIDFPYPVYTEERLRKDYANLCNYASNKYNSHAKLGISTIRHFHQSIYDAKVGTSCSIKEAWNNDDILKKVIHNRMIYQNDIDPSKILAGFYISKIVPKVSVFNPVLARYLTLKYLNQYNVVNDPFSGFSGRMLGVTSTGKQYVGSDINLKAISECNEIIQFHSLDAIVTNQNIVTTLDRTRCECLLTCPPYFKKEVYSNESEFKTCDDWIKLVLEKFYCDKYVFVVDTTHEFQQYIQETITTKSYFSDVNEYVIVI